MRSIEVRRDEVSLFTTNPGKIREAVDIGACFSLRVIPVKRCVEVVEDCDTFLGNAKKKALAGARLNNCRCVAEDSGLVVDTLGGLPGVYSARFAELDLESLTLGVVGENLGQMSRVERDEQNNKRLLQLLGNSKNRAGRYICSVVYASPGGEVMAHVERECEVMVEFEARGTNGFGYDPIVSSPQFSGKTFAELLPAEKNLISHRRQALSALFREIVS